MDKKEGFSFDNIINQPLNILFLCGTLVGRVGVWRNVGSQPNAIFTTYLMYS